MWYGTVSNLNINERVYPFNKIILNISLSFVLHETVICDDKDPLWINKYSNRNLINDSNILFKSSGKIKKCLNKFNETSD